jgi:hypothetical protein
VSFRTASIIFLAECDVRDEAAIHHVEMNHVRAAFDAHGNFVGEARKIRAQYRRSDAGFHRIITACVDWLDSRRRRESGDAQVHASTSTDHLSGAGDCPEHGILGLE